MQAIADIPPKTSPAWLNPEAPTLFVRVNVPADAVCKTVFPPGNLVGAQLFCMWLESAMEAANVRVYLRAFGMEFNRSIYMFRVSNPRRGLEVIKEQAQQQGLLSFLQIAWHDPREGVQRPFYPEGIKFEMPSSAEIEAVGAGIKAAMARIVEQQRSTNEPNGS